MPIKLKLYPTNPDLPARDPTPPASGATTFFDVVSRPRVLEVALLAAAIVSPVFNPTPPPTAATTFFDQARARSLEVALLPATAFQPQGTIVSVTPQGYEAIFPVQFRAPFPVKLQVDNRDTWMGLVPTAFVGNAWVAMWDGPQRKPFPAPAQQFAPWQPQGDVVSTPQGWPFAWPERFRKPVPVSEQPYSGDMWIGSVPTQFVANAWIAAWDGPRRAPFPTGAQQFTPDQRLFPDLPPNGWPTTYPERFSKPYPSKAQLWNGDAWQGLVPTAATPQGWPAVFPERFRKPLTPAVVQFDLPVLAAYTSTVVTFPEGWRVVVPERGQSVRRAPGWEVSFTPAVVFTLGWPAVLPDAVRPRLLVTGSDGTPEAAPGTQALRGWAIEWSPTRSRPVARGADTISFQATATFTAWSAGWDARPAPSARQRAADIIWPPFIKAAPPATLGDTALWNSISYSFRRIRPPSPDFERLRFKVPLRIGSQPALTGVSTNPTLSGVSTGPTLLGVSTNPTLSGVSTGPTLLGVSTNPTLSGEV